MIHAFLGSSLHESQSSYYSHIHISIVSFLLVTMPEDAPTSRAREQTGGDEEATSDLKLGEFQNVHSMSLSEARALIIAILAHRATTKKVEETE